VRKRLVGSLLALALTATAAPAAAQGARFVLPDPSHSAQLGMKSFRLVDTTRADPWRKPAQPFRELMVSVFYPAWDVARYPVAPQMLPGAAGGFDDFAGPGNLGVPSGLVDWASTRTHAHEGAPIDLCGGPRPVLLYSAGAGDPRTWDTSEVEDLASRGYVVVTVDHTYEAAGVEFPGGRVERTLLPEQMPPSGPPPESLLRKVVDTRVADVRFVLDQLDSLAPGMDMSRIGMFGHSGGGFTALQAMHDDRRIWAAVNMDGLLSYAPEDTGVALSTAASEGVDRPFLLLGHEPGGHTTRPSWGSLWDHSTSWKKDVVVKDSGHASFTDGEAVLPQIARQVALPEPISATIGTADPRQVISEMRTEVAGFFDRFVSGDHGMARVS
jgi:hypothetical protein